jgi:hypothetical protein
VGAWRAPTIMAKAIAFAGMHTSVLSRSTAVHSSTSRSSNSSFDNVQVMSEDGTGAQTLDMADITCQMSRVPFKCPARDPICPGRRVRGWCVCV